MRAVRIWNLSRELPGVLQAHFCNTFACRLRGLMFRKKLSKNEGLLLAFDRESRLDAAIHMLFMWLDLTVVWVNAEKQVVDVRLARRWRPVYVPQRPACYVLEIAPSWIESFSIGDQLDFEEIKP